MLCRKRADVQFHNQERSSRAKMKLQAAKTSGMADLNQTRFY